MSSLGISHEVFVITANGTPRNRNLNDFLNDEYRIFDSNLSVDFIEDIIDQEANSLVLGRELTTNEIKCLGAHRAIMNKSLKEWLIVLEDDAIIKSSDFTELLRLIGSVVTKKPTIFLLYIGKSGVFSKFKSKIIKNDIFSAHRCFALPSGAVAYAVNMSSRKIIVDCNCLVGTADWPTWSTKIRFYGIFPQIVEHDFTQPSLVDAWDTEIRRDTWPEYRYILREMFVKIFIDKYRSAFGGVFNYFRLNFAAAFFRRISNYLNRIFIKT